MKAKDGGGPADIALLLEGTYPYVRGGVSSWTHDIIQGLPEYTFTLVFLGGARENYDGIRYELPPNVVGLQSHYLMEPEEIPPPSPRKGSREAFAQFERLHEYFRKPGPEAPRELIRRAAELLGEPGGVTAPDFLYSREAWERIKRDYEKFCYDPSFVDYFWTVRSMHAPLFKLARIARHAPDAKAFHSISTGYAGFLGSLLKSERGAPFILTEHGNYTKERRIDLVGAEWIKNPESAFSGEAEYDVSYILRLWIRFYEGLGRLAYDAADPIIAIYDGNRRRQIEDGADPARTMVVRNGIDLARFEPALARRPDRIPPVLGLIGRVVAIKDVKTFIRAMRTVISHIPEAQGWIIGPHEEDPEYVEECMDLMASMGLSEKIKFLGFRKVEEVLPELGLVVLTSISEAMPLVLLEGFAGGVPAVATDVGSCREIIEGSGPEDKAIGAAGAVTPIANAEATANAAISLLTNEDEWRAAQAAGLERVRRFYTKEILMDSYRGIYGRAIKRIEWPG
ncbi:MAG: GT4 family glycosyltransferase PelF [Candidatus Nitrospinota bacterium M3_3B_026]